MGAYSGTEIANDGLVFHFDMANTKKSWKGKPTINYMVENGHATQSTSITENDLPDIEQLKSLTGGIVYSPVSQLNNTTLNFLDFHRVSDVVLQPDETIVISVYVYPLSSPNRFNSNGNFGETLGTNAGLGSPSNLEVNTWQRLTFAKRNTTESPITVDALRIEPYTPSQWGGEINVYASNPQCEVIASGDTVFATPFVKGTRTNTETIIDLTKKNIITASSLIYESDNTFSMESAGGVGVAGDYMSCGNSPELNFGTNNFSLEFVTYRTAYGFQGGSYISKGDGTSLGFDFRDTNFYVHSTLGLVARLPFAPTQNIWIHHTIIYDTSASPYITYYKNGTFDSTSNINDSEKIGSIDTSRNLDIGRSQAGGVQRYFNGKMPLVKIYNRALSASEVKNNFEAVRSRYGI